MVDSNPWPAKIEYSIIIPTRNSTEFLKNQLEIILKSDRLDFEVIISDNNDIHDQELNVYQKDKRVRIIRPVSVLSMSSNYEFAINHALGQWIQLIGSDDAILPWYFEKLDLLLNKYRDFKVITWSRAYFFWPDSPSVYDGRCLEFSGNFKEKICNSKSQFFSSILGFKSIFDLPQLYTGSLINKDLIKEIKSHSFGLFYHSIIPDIYSSVTLMSFVTKYVHCNLPMTLIGTSGNTMGFSNRIYADSNDLDYFDIKSPRNLHSSINLSFHSLGFSSIYLLESFRCLPFFVSKYNKYFCTLFAYAGVFNDLRINRMNIVSIKLIIEQLRKDPNFGISSFCLLLIIIPFLKIARFFYFKLYIPSIFKLNGGLRRSDKFFNVKLNNRDIYSNIQIAVNELSSRLKFL